MLLRVDSCTEPDALPHYFNTGPSPLIVGSSGCFAEPTCPDKINERTKRWENTQRTIVSGHFCEACVGPSSSIPVRCVVLLHDVPGLVGVAGGGPRGAGVPHAEEVVVAAHEWSPWRTSPRASDSRTKPPPRPKWPRIRRTRLAQVPKNPIVGTQRLRGYHLIRRPSRAFASPHACAHEPVYPPHTRAYRAELS
jgi:hypothetical protein